ncbi:acyl-CoA N-acyltransferase [Catenaria anguillulae PL171]|uniref:Acyl-CoA N-acyltransferase n=1 Tax=Catenaria anguillulae PL171 TaxID=765915 RepID=A0A1Y2HB16_9FUNG|nr:acyl-CoA N-acyltransferase [Catenaria anguillulae PL171]
MSSEYQVHHAKNRTDLSDQDLDSIAAIISVAFRAKFAHVGLNDDQTTQLNKAHILDDIRHPKNVYLVARRTSDGTIAGVCELLVPTVTTGQAESAKKHDPEEHLKQFTKTLGFLHRMRVGKLRMVLSDDQEKELVSGEAYVKAIAVDSEFRGKGIGNMLLAHAHAMVAGLGFTSISLHVAANNRRAKQLYERVGYVEDAEKSVMKSGERAYCRFFVGEDGFYYLTKSFS